MARVKSNKTQRARFNCPIKKAKTEHVREKDENKSRFLEGTSRQLTQEAGH
jgi:hypothetical protein